MESEVPPQLLVSNPRCNSTRSFLAAKGREEGKTEGMGNNKCSFADRCDGEKEAVQGERLWRLPGDGKRKEWRKGKGTCSTIPFLFLTCIGFNKELSCFFKC